MNIKSLQGSDLIVIDAMLSLDSAVNAKELSRKVPLSYDTVLKVFRDHAAMGLIIKIKGSGGRYTANMQNPCMEYFERIRGIETKPVEPIYEPGRHPPDTVIVPRTEDKEAGTPWMVLE